MRCWRREENREIAAAAVAATLLRLASSKTATVLAGRLVVWFECRWTIGNVETSARLLRLLLLLLLLRGRNRTNEEYMDGSLVWPRPIDRFVTLAYPGCPSPATVIRYERAPSLQSYWY
uniref:Putative secreted protein n=1 Tax=Anopheles marajoara TaxID=58244 RepID=A0A2M4C7H5_9DIPT